MVSDLARIDVGLMYLHPLASDAAYKLPWCIHVGMPIELGERDYCTYDVDSRIYEGDQGLPGRDLNPKSVCMYVFMYIY